MPESWLFPVGLPFGLGTTDQVVPSQDKICVFHGPKFEYRPAAVQELVEIHDTALSSVKVPAPGLPTADQVVPSHISTRENVSPWAARSTTSPTATQKLVETQDTPLSPPSSSEPPGVGLGTTDQVLPSHISTRVC